MSQRTCCIEGCEKPFHGRGVCRPHYMKCWRRQMEWPEWAPPPSPSEHDRFWAKVLKTDDCWLWQASCSPNGYGQFGHEGAHRVALRLVGTSLPVGTHVDHLCRVQRCVNPEHLEVVTPSENVRRGYAPPIAAARMRAWSASRTHCKWGHELTEANTYITPREGWRVCRACKQARATRKREGIAI